MPLLTIFQLYHGNQGTRKKPPTCLKSLTNLFTFCCMAVHLAMSGIHTHNFSVIATDCIGSCESNYHAITTTTAPKMNQQNCFLSSTAKNLRYFTKNKPSFCQNKKIVTITSHFLKFQAQAAIKTFNIDINMIVQNLYVKIIKY